MIRYVVGDATQPIGTGTKVLCHICNDRGGWGKGFVLAVSKRWPDPEQMYRHQYQFGLGCTQFIQVETRLHVANMIAQHGYRAAKAGPPIRYEALRACLRSVGSWAREHKATVHMPRIGTGLAGGDWKIIEPMIREELDGINVTVYSLARN